MPSPLTPLIPPPLIPPPPPSHPPHLPTVASKYINLCKNEQSFMEKTCNDSSADSHYCKVLQMLYENCRYFQQIKLDKHEKHEKHSKSSP